MINRIEIIDYTESGKGRTFVKTEDFDFTFDVVVQDGGKTVKIFLEDIEKESK